MVAVSTFILVLTGRAALRILGYRIDCLFVQIGVSGAFRLPEALIVLFVLDITDLVVLSD